MPFEDLMAAVQRMSSAIDTVAVLGAELSLQTQDSGADPRIAAALKKVSTAAGIPDLADIPAPQRAMALNVIRLTFKMAEDLLNDPGRAPGWVSDDVEILEGMGRGSMMIPPMLAQVPELQNVTALLDAGVGVGWLAVGAANVWPAATVVGIDIFETALERARKNVADAGLADRVTLRNEDVTALADKDTFDCAWIPTFFLPEENMAPALAHVVSALKPGGWVVLGLFETVPNPLANATIELRTVRSGGCTLDETRAGELLRTAGCANIRTLDKTSPMPIRFVIGQKPA